MSSARSRVQLLCSLTFHSLGDPYTLHCLIRNNSETTFFNLRIRFSETKYEKESTTIIEKLTPHDPEDDPMDVAIHVSVKRTILLEHAIEDLGHEFTITLEEVEGKMIVSTTFSRRLQAISCPSFSKFGSPAGYIPHQFNILVFGKVSSGKTSTINSFYTLLNSKCQIVQLGNVRDGEDHCTKTIQRYEFKKNGSTKMIDDYNFTITDCWGLDEKNYTDFKFLSLLEGGLPGNWRMDYSFELYQELIRRTPELIVENKIHRKIHCVIFVITFTDILNLDRTGERIKKFFHKLRSIVRDPIIVVSRTDDIIPKFRENPTLETDQMEKVRYYISKKLLVSPNDIFFGINYIQEIKVNFGIDRRNFQILYRSLCTAQRNYLNSMVEITIEYDNNNPHIFGESYQVQVHLRNKTKNTLRHLRLFFMETSCERESSKYISFLPPHEEDSDPSTIINLEIESKKNSVEDISKSFKISLETDNRDKVISRRRFERDLRYVAFHTLKKMSPPSGYFSKTYNICLIGSSESGKSSFINSIYTLLNPSRRICSLVPSKSSFSERYEFNGSGVVDFAKDCHFSILNALPDHLSELTLEELLIGECSSSKRMKREEVENRKIHACICFIKLEDLLLLLVRGSHEEEEEEERYQQILVVMKNAVTKIQNLIGAYPIIVISKSDETFPKLRSHPEKFSTEKKMKKLKSILANFLGMKDTENHIFYGLNYPLDDTSSHFSNFGIDRLNFSIIQAALTQASQNFTGLSLPDFRTEMKLLRSEMDVTKSKVQKLMEKMMDYSPSRSSRSGKYAIFEDSDEVGRFALLVGQKYESCVYTSQKFEEELKYRMGYETIRMSNVNYSQFKVSVYHFIRRIEKTTSDEENIKKKFLFYYCGTAEVLPNKDIILEFLSPPEEGKEEQDLKNLKTLLKKLDGLKNENCEIFVVIDIYRIKRTNETFFEELCPPRICNSKKKNFVFGFCCVDHYQQEEKEDQVLLKFNEYSSEIMKRMNHCIPLYQILTLSGEKVKLSLEEKKECYLFVDYVCSESVLDSCL